MAAFKAIMKVVVEEVDAVVVEAGAIGMTVIVVQVKRKYFLQDRSTNSL